MTNLTIRKAVKEDEPFLFEMLYLSLFVPEGGKPFEQSILDNPDISKYVKEWGREGDTGFIVLMDGEPVGSITSRFFTEENKGYGFIDEAIQELSMAIKPAFRGQGIGSNLLKTMLDELKKNGVRAVSLSVDHRNPALRLYSRFGFVAVKKDGPSITMKLDL